ncbi:MAG: extracellular solute-binding protein [Desulfobulbaceae bacterium]|nr:extracellular solute-binding protein [Desulfobulbaceae bacterium]
MNILKNVLLFVAISILLSNCSAKEEKPLLIYAGDGLKMAMQEVEEIFEERYQCEIQIIYAGSKSLLTALQRSRQGDIFIPGALHYLEEAGDLVAHHHLIGHHVPVFAVHKDNQKKIRSYEDLTNKNISIAVGNKDTCSIGRLSDEIIRKQEFKEKISANMAVLASTVNALVSVLNQGTVDVAIIWLDMLQWPEAAELTGIPIPSVKNEIQPIHVGVLTTSPHQELADTFAKFMVDDGRDIFTKHGFGG